MYKDFLKKIKTTRKSSKAENAVRILTTAKGGNPNRMACFPKIGTIPRKRAEPRAAKMPRVRSLLSGELTLRGGALLTRVVASVLGLLRVCPMGRILSLCLM